MSGNDCLLDRNIVIGLFANEPLILEKLSLVPGVIKVPSIVLGELFFGAEQSTKRHENILRIERFAQACTNLVCDANTSMAYGKLKSQLKSNGTPLPENDVWKAALAEQHQIKLVTRDSHFKSFNSFPIEYW
ncbi:MAG: type II toxin-antitoxin system VapC family toxin [Bacteroidetes bacterium]|nr:type II toxin-antitoxin system VapC family toxin [Bacteroidota bacterium]